MAYYCPAGHFYGFSSRFEGKPGTNPEGLIAALRASCFTMALSLILGAAKLTAQHMDTKAVNHRARRPGHWLNHDFRCETKKCEN